MHMSSKEALPVADEWFNKSVSALSNFDMSLSESEHIKFIGHRSDLSAYFDSAGATNSIIAALNHLAGKWIRVYDENGVLLN